MTQTSVQLYSVRDAVDADIDAAIDRVSQIGYTQVEPYAFHKRVADYRRAFATSGVTAPSGHAPVIDSVQPEVVLDAAAELGIGFVIDPFIPTERWQQADDVHRLADRVSALAEQARERGLRFGYHNHQWEFANQIDGRSAFELFAERLDPRVPLEIDTFWATVGGADTPAVLRSLGERVQALHVKDGQVTGDIASVLPSSEDALVVPERLKAAYENQAPAGQGDVDIISILRAAPHALRVVEFDSYKGDVFKGITESLAWLAANDAQEAV